MPWGRLHDQANRNEKLLALSDPAWRLWGSGLIYCQDKLTDGFIPEAVVSTFGVKARPLKKFVVELCQSLVPGKESCWHQAEGGYRVHDYLDWNESREVILAKRARGKDRTGKWRGKWPRDASQAVSHGTSPTPSPPMSVTPSVTTDPRTTIQGVSLQKPKRDTRGHRGLTFAGKRLEIPKWLDKEFANRLGGANEEFNLNEWYVKVDAELSRAPEIVYDVNWVRQRFAEDSPAPERRATTRHAQPRAGNTGPATRDKYADFA